MVEVRETVMPDWPALRDIRLAALRDAPEAFSSTYAEQVNFGPEQWQQRIARGGTFLAFLPGIGGPGLSRQDPGLTPGHLRRHPRIVRTPRPRSVGAG